MLRTAAEASQDSSWLPNSLGDSRHQHGQPLGEETPVEHGQAPGDHNPNVNSPTEVGQLLDPRRKRDDDLYSKYVNTKKELDEVLPCVQELNDAKHRNLLLNSIVQQLEKDLQASHRRREQEQSKQPERQEEHGAGLSPSMQSRALESCEHSMIKNTAVAVA